MKSFLVLASLIATHAAVAAEFKILGHTITVPDGFEVELVAGPGLVDRPIEADLDEQGRLYVTDSSGTNDKPDKQLQDKPHRIVRLEDTDGDGRYDKSVVFADKMMFPEGALWFNGSLYVAAPPSIWKLTDTNDDGVADKREEWFQGKTLTGCANDLHGPYLGPDGWIYWTKGAFAKQTYTRPGKPDFVTRVSHIFRARPDGSGIEPVMIGGMDNPVCVVFTPGGERIFTTTFFQRPEAGKRDGMIHAIYGGVYGKPNDATDDHKKTGDLMPVLTHMGPAVPCGLIRYASRLFGSDYEDNLFCCQFNLHKVSRHMLVPTGATFETRDSDFLISDNIDFHPTDVLEDADGSLLVVDTGGWYKLCCPTSQLHKPDVLGAIYRVKRKGAPKLPDPRGLKIPWAEMQPNVLANLLGDPRPAVRQRAIVELAGSAEKSVPILKQFLKAARNRNAASDEQTRLNAVWALTRIDGPAAREAGRTAFDDDSETVALAAVHSASVWRDRGAVDPLIGVLKKPSASLKRAAAEALGRIGDKRAVPALLTESGARTSSSAVADRVLEHSLTHALIEIADPDSVAAGLKATNAHTRRAALIALDQMDGGNLKPTDITPLLLSSEPVLKQTAEWIVSHRADWGEALAGFFKERLSASEVSEQEREQLQNLLRPLTRSVHIQKVLADIATDNSSAAWARTSALRVMAQSGLKELPDTWVEPLSQILSGSEPELVRRAVSVARALPTKAEYERFNAALLKVAGQETNSVEVRLDALAALPSGTKLTGEFFQFVRDELDRNKPVNSRGAAAAVLAKARLTSDDLLEVADTLKTANPLEIPKLLQLFARSTNEAVGLKLTAALNDPAVRAVLRPDLLRGSLTNFPPTVQQRIEELVLALDANLAGQRSRLEELLSGLPSGDIRRGQTLFNSSQTACSACHMIGYLGGNIGPDLTRIGQVRTERDLLESIIYPSASFVRSYEPIIVVTKSGDQVNGVLRKDAPDEVVLATGPNVEVRLARAEITETRPSTISIMPEGLDHQLNRQQLADLLAFLKATRW